MSLSEGPAPLRWPRDRWPFVLLLVGVFGAAIAYRGGLGFEIYLDEYWFWKQTLWFVDRWPPSLAELQNYPEPMTPLSFLVWGLFEVATGAGVAGARLVTIVMGVTLLSLIALPRQVAAASALRATIGLVLFPYTIALSIHVYTDVPAALFTLGGFWLYARRRAWLAGLSFALAIATRQYMVIFPAALLAAELAPLLLPGALLRILGAEPAGPLRRGDPRVRRALPIVLSATSLLAWIAFFGGLGPQHGVELWPRHNVSLTGLEPGFALYFLTCMGAYFVVPEVVIYRRFGRMRELLRSRAALLTLVVTAALYVTLFPISSDMPMGPINRSLRAILPEAELGLLSDAIRLVVYSGLAWLTCVRFARLDLVSWLLLASACLMLTSHEGWEKYNLATLATLWYLRSLAPLDGPFELWGAARSEPDRLEPPELELPEGGGS